MKNIVSYAFATCLALGAMVAVADPAQDQAALKKYFHSQHPNIELKDYINGVYAMNPGIRVDWESIEEFPPYEEFVDKGREIYNKKFANGKSFASCFGKDPSAVRVKYPHWDSKAKKVITLEAAINDCLKKNGEKPFGWKKGKLAWVSAYLAYEARGQKINVKVPPEAMDAYNDGKHFFYAKRGQLNMSCADCHVYNAGKFIRGNVLSPMYGHTTHFPVYRGKWARGNEANDGLGTLHRRYGGCNKQVRARPFKAQSKEYTNLEFFEQVMSNGLEINGPGYRE